MKRIFFITNLSRYFGYGHFKRCLNLAEELKKNYKIFFIKNKIIKNKLLIPYKLIDFKELKKKNINNQDIFILDIIEEEFYKNNFVKLWNYICDNSKTILIDNDFNKKWKCSIKVYPYLKNNKKRYTHSGIKYATFDKKIIELSRRKIKKDNNIIITMGGSDPYGLTKKILKDFISQKIDINLYVIIGPYFSNNEKKNIKKICKYKKNIFIFDNPKNYYYLLFKSRLAIVNSGNLKYECAILGTPFILLANQRKNIKTCNNFKKKFKVINPKNFLYRKFNVTNLINKFFYNNKLLNNYAKYNKNIFGKKIYNFFDLVKKDF